MNEWNNVLISADTSIQDAIKIIDRHALQIALVVDEDLKLLGTITDGDIRRGILKGIPLVAPAHCIMNKNPVTISDIRDKRNILNVLSNKKLRHLPVVDRSGRIIGLERLEELVACPNKETWVILMAGGLGGRLRPLTDNCPKPMLSINGKPVLETILENFTMQGFYKFYISINYEARQIETYFGDGSNWGAEIHYIHEDKMLGTAGSLSLFPEKTDQPVIVMNGDILTKLSFSQLISFHNEHQAQATVAVHTYCFQIPYGVVKANGDILAGFEEKPVYTNFINSGIYVFNPEALSKIPENTYLDMDRLLCAMLNDGERVSVFPIREYWIDIGTLEDFNRAKLDFNEVFG